MSSKINVNSLTVKELNAWVSSAMYQLSLDYKPGMYPTISITNSSPQEKRGWLLTNFPVDFTDGVQITGSKGGHRRNRGIKYS